MKEGSTGEDWELKIENGGLKIEDWELIIDNAKSKITVQKINQRYELRIKLREFYINHSQLSIINFQFNSYFHAFTISPVPVGCVWFTSK